MALAFAGARGQGGNALNGLHPCTLPQRAPFAAVRRVSPLCAAFCPDSECVRGATGKANVAPTCGQREKCRCNTAAQRRESPAAAGKILPFGRSQHRIWLVAGVPASCQMPNIGQQPEPTLYERRIYDKGQTIQHSDLKTGFRSDTPNSGSGAHEPERLRNQLLSGQENHHS